MRSSFPHLLPDLARDFSSGSSLFLAPLRSAAPPSSCFAYSFLPRPGSSSSAHSSVSFFGALCTSSLRPCCSPCCGCAFFFACASSWFTSACSSFLFSLVYFVGLFFWFSLRSRSSCSSSFSCPGFGSCAWVGCGCPFFFWGSPFPYPLLLHLVLQRPLLGRLLPPIPMICLRLSLLRPLLILSMMLMIVTQMKAFHRLTLCALFESFFAPAVPASQSLAFNWFNRVRTTLVETDARVADLLASGCPELPDVASAFGDLRS